VIVTRNELRYVDLAALRPDYPSLPRIQLWDYLDILESLYVDDAADDEDGGVHYRYGVTALTIDSANRNAPDE
jgi:hypothetical protein